MRLGLMPFSMHVDPLFTGDIASFPYYVQVWNSPEIKAGGFLYPPLFYHTISVYLQQFANLFSKNLWDQPIFGPEAQLNWLISPFVFRNLFLLKAWYLLPDLGIALVLWRIYHKKPSQTQAVLLWTFNPLVLYTAYFHGQFDLIPVFFVALGILAVWERQPLWAALGIGFGACYKNYPFIFLLPLALILAKDLRSQLKILIVGVLPYIIFFVPAMKNYTTVGSFLSRHFFVGSLELGSGAQVYFFFAFYAALLWYLYHRQVNAFEGIWRVCLAILLIYYQFSYFDLHYWVWIAPFTIIYWIEHQQEAKPFYLIIGLCLLVLLIPTPLGRFLAPISPHFFLRLPSLLEILSPYLPVMFIVNIVRSLMAGTIFYLAWKLVREIPKPVTQSQTTPNSRLQSCPERP